MSSDNESGSNCSLHLATSCLQPLLFLDEFHIENRACNGLLRMLIGRAEGLSGDSSNTAYLCGRVVCKGFCTYFIVNEAAKADLLQRFYTFFA